MDREVAESEAESQEAGDVRADYHRKNIEEIRAAVTRGAAGMEASYLYDQEVLFGLGR